MELYIYRGQLHITGDDYLTKRQERTQGEVKCIYIYILSFFLLYNNSETCHKTVTAIGVHVVIHFSASALFVNKQDGVANPT